MKAVFHHRKVAEVVEAPPSSKFLRSFLHVQLSTKALASLSS